MYDQNDSGNASLFRDENKGKLLFDSTHREEKIKGRWLVWQGNWWEVASDHLIFQQALAAIEKRKSLALRLSGAAKKEEQRFTLRSGDVNRINAMLNAAKHMPGIVDDEGDWDKKANLVGVKNGVVDLFTAAYVKPDQSQRITRHIPYEADLSATAPLWDKTINDIFNRDTELCTFIQQAVGYSISGDMREQVLFCLCGPGSNGKSTFLDTVSAILGPYTYTMPFSTIDKMTRSNISNDVASIMNHRFVISSESDEDAVLNSARIKGLTGDRTATARKLYENNKTFIPQAKYWLAFNMAPAVVDCSYGFWRRIRKIDLLQEFPPGGNIFDALMKEYEGILGWMIQGAADWFLANRLPCVACIDASTSEYRAENDKLNLFISSCLEIEKALTCINTDAYDAYCDFAKDVLREKPLSHRKFTQQMVTKGFKPGHTGKERIWNGFTLKAIKTNRSPSFPNILF